MVICRSLYVLSMNSTRHQLLHIKPFFKFIFIIMFLIIIIIMVIHQSHWISLYVFPFVLIEFVNLFPEKPMTTTVAPGSRSGCNVSGLTDLQSCRYFPESCPCSVSTTSPHKALIDWLCHEDCLSGNICSALSVYLNSTVQSTCASATVRLLHQLFGAIFDNTTSPKNPRHGHGDGRDTVSA